MDKSHFLSLQRSKLPGLKVSTNKLPECSSERERHLVGKMTELFLWFMHSTSSSAGAYIEDNIEVGATGAELLSNIPCTVQKIEAWMGVERKPACMSCLSTNMTSH